MLEVEILENEASKIPRVDQYYYALTTYYLTALS